MYYSKKYNLDKLLPLESNVCASDQTHVALYSWSLRGWVEKEINEPFQKEKKEDYFPPGETSLVAYRRPNHALLIFLVLAQNV